LERLLAEVGLLDRAAPLLTATDAGLAENRSPGPVAVETLRRLQRGGARAELGARSREASRFVETAARGRGLDVAGFQGVSAGLHAQAAARWAESNARLAMAAWGVGWEHRVADSDSAPVNDIAVMPADPAVEAAVAALVQDACGHFGITLRPGWMAGVGSLADRAASLAATAVQRGRTMFCGSVSVGSWGWRRRASEQPDLHRSGQRSSAFPHPGPLPEGEGEGTG
ncbi:MAG: hypothetical protein ACRYGM_20040, partial [Janthinobacterium lividum]